MLTWCSRFFSSSEHPPAEIHSMCKVKIHLTCGTTFDAPFAQQYCPIFPLYWWKSEVCSEVRPWRKNSSSSKNIIKQLKQWKQLFFHLKFQFQISHCFLLTHVCCQFQNKERWSGLHILKKCYSCNKNSYRLPEPTRN